MVRWCRVPQVPAGGQVHALRWCVSRSCMVCDYGGVVHTGATGHLRCPLALGSQPAARGPQVHAGRWRVTRSCIVCDYGGVVQPGATGHLRCPLALGSPPAARRPQVHAARWHLTLRCLLALGSELLRLGLTPYKPVRTYCTIPLGGVDHPPLLGLSWLVCIVAAPDSSSCAGSCLRFAQKPLHLAQTQICLNKSCCICNRHSTNQSGQGG